MSEERKKLAVIVIGNSFSLRWLEAWTDFLARCPAIWDINLIWSRGPLVHWNRAGAAEDALQLDPPCDYILWVDHDNPPFAALAVQLYSDLESDPSIGMACGWYLTEMGFASFGRSFKIIGTDGFRRQFADIEDFILPDSPTVQDVDWSGLGLVMMRRDALLKTKPECFMPMKEDLGEFNRDNFWGWIGEDMGFCKAARAAGVRIVVDRRVRCEHQKLMDVTMMYGKLPIQVAEREAAAAATLSACTTREDSPDSPAAS